ncbi:MAG: hypothetical protein M0005_10285 [Actinomycetota bacterium]|jgi:hypothetical protein|nr:hypothetical protein [Actinomycetota bacterium]
MSPRAPRPGADDLDVLIEKVDPEDMRLIVGKAAERYEDVARAVRLTAARGSGDLSQLRAEIDRGLRTSRHLGYPDSGGWAMQARPIVEAIGKAVGSPPTAELGPDDDVLSWAARGERTRRCSGCAGSSTGGWRRRPPTASSAPPPRSAERGRPSDQGHGRCWPSTTSAAWRRAALRR